MEDFSKRLTPEEALKIATPPEEQRGKLKIFIGYAPGVGKTYSMLNEGNRRLVRGEDIVIGYFEPHDRPDTKNQIGKLQIIPKKKIEYSGKILEEMDTDAIIKRHPRSVLVDELAHTNVPGSKNKKRYEDVAEILDAGINVITTLNVQHMESLVDTIKQITGVTVRETIPDKIVEKADEIVAVDITIEALINRLKRGDVYKLDKIDEALSNFFRKGNLNALREISLRQTAQEVDEELEQYMQAHNINENWQTTERIMVCIGPGTNSNKLIRRGAAMAKRYKCDWFVVAVELENVFYGKWSQSEKEQTENHFALAEQFGAKTVTLMGRSIFGEILKFAKQKHITQIVLGHSDKNYFESFIRGSLINRLLRETKNIAVHVIPLKTESGETPQPSYSSIKFKVDFRSSFMEYFMILWVVAFVTGVSLLLAPYTGYRAIGFIYLLAVLFISLFVSFIPIVIASLICALTWNFFFIPPFGTLSISRPEDLLMHLTFFFTAIVAGFLTYRVRTNEKMLLVRSSWNDAIYKIVYTIAGAADKRSCIEEIQKQMNTMLPGDFYIIAKDAMQEFDKTIEGRADVFADKKELSVAKWSFDKGTPAGWSTETLMSAKAIYIPLKGPSETVGILAYRPYKEEKLNQEQANLIAAISKQIAVYLEKELFRERSKQVQELEKSEKMLQTILESISHEMRTPLTSIGGIASALNEEKINQDKTVREDLIKELLESVDRLNNVVGNILDMSRINSGSFTLKREWNDIGEIIDVSVKQLREKLKGHKLSIEIKEGLPLVMLDFNLFEQAVSNILINAINYTPEGSEIKIRSFLKDDDLILEISDNGPGISEDQLVHIFEKFYRVKGSPAGGVGLGLTLTKSIIEAHGGFIFSANKKGGGLEFKISLPVEKQPDMMAGQYE
ncbi:MAG: sensor histidine kinase KdpD [Candidatus Saganbacteria bacterium]|nr:sensor histidine kinase KdpD [Candidatus Saganbacteria bacterium]